MTWVKGTTTWGNLTQDLTRLITGEIADGSSVTVATGDRWVREQTRTVTDGVLNSTTTLTSATASFASTDVGSRVFGTGIPGNTTISSVTNNTTVVMSAAATASASGVTVQICTDALRTPSSVDVASGNISNRTGYFALWSSSITIPGGINSVARVSNPFTSDPSTSGFHRWLVQISVNTANTVSGNYSTANIGYLVIDADSGTTLANNSATPTSGGVATLTSGLQVTLSDPSGFLTVNTSWRRGFTSTYMYGIDHWPFYSRRSGSSTFSVAPPGSSGTDYDIVEQVAAYNGQYVNERGNLFTGLGIKTATGLGTGALYTVSWNMAYAKGRIFNSTTTGTLGLDVGKVVVDTVNGNTMRVSHGIRTQTWCKAFQTAGSVTTSSVIQYWISVKPGGIMLALQGDPGSTGKLSTAYFGDFTPYDSTYDVFPIIFNAGQTDYTINTSGNDGAMNFEKGYWRLRRCQDGSEGSRDWQTKWMRSDFGNGDSYGNGYTSDLSSLGTTNIAWALGYQTDQAGISASYGYTPARQTKPVPVDSKWWFYGFQYSDFNMVGQSNFQANIDERRLVRGYHTSRYLYLPAEGWGNGDELTDTSTTQKYLLLTPDYMAQGGRMRTATNTYFGGIAIAEL